MTKKQIKEIKAALNLVPKAFNSLMREYVSRKGPATDWGLVNECLLKVAAARAALGPARGKERDCE